MTTKTTMTEDEYLALVERVQQAMCIEPFRPAMQDVMVLIAEWRLLSNETERLRAAIQEAYDVLNRRGDIEHVAETLREALGR